MDIHGYSWLGAANDGAGVTQDGHMAAYWWRMAAEQGHTAAQYYLGLVLFHGIATLPPYSVGWHKRIAAQYWHAAAAAGGAASADAMYCVGRWYIAAERGVGRLWTERWQWLVSDEAEMAHDGQLFLVAGNPTDSVTNE